MDRSHSYYIEGDDELVEYRERIARCFRPATPVEDRTLFAGRIKQMQSLVQAVEDDGQHAVIYGERGAGKTSLATVHQLLTETSFDSQYLTCSTKTTFNTIWTDFYCSLYRVSECPVDLDRPAQVVALLREASSERPVVVYVDEYDRVLDDDCRTLMSDTIKALSDARIPATVVLVGVADDAALIVANHASTARCLTQILVPWMSPKELEEIGEKAFACAGIAYDYDTLQRIVYSAMGLPYYVHLVGREAARIAVGERRRKVSLRHVGESIIASWEYLDATIRNSYDQATSGQHGAAYRLLILALAITQVRRNRERAGSGFFPGRDVRPALQTAKKGLKLRRTPTAQLQRLGTAELGTILVQRAGPGSTPIYRFDNPAMAPYVIMRSMEEGLIDRYTLERLLPHESRDGQASR